MERSVKKYLYIAKQVFDCISPYTRAGERLKGLFIITRLMETEDHQIQ